MRNEKYFLWLVAIVGILIVAPDLQAAGSRIQGPPGPVPATYFGMHMHHAQNWPTVPFGSLRLWDDGTSWTEIEKTRGTSNWTAFDKWLGLARSSGADVLYVFGRTPQWASSNPSAVCGNGPGQCAPPADLRYWDDFVRAVATRSAGRVKYWEIWNEPTNKKQWNGDARMLAVMAQHACSIIKSIDPEAKILTPSVSAYHHPGNGRNISDWLEQYFAAGGSSCTDIVAFHGYYFANPEDIISIVDNIRNTMNAYGLGSKPLWDTEASWGVPSDLGDQEAQAAFLARYYVLHWLKGVDRFYWYACDSVQWGGLWDSSQEPNAAARAYAEVQKWLIGARLEYCDRSPDETWTCSISRSDDYHGLIVWNSRGAAAAAYPASPTRTNGAMKRAGTGTASQEQEYVQYRDLDRRVELLRPGQEPIIGSKPILFESRRTF